MRKGYCREEQVVRSPLWQRGECCKVVETRLELYQIMDFGIKKPWMETPLCSYCFGSISFLCEQGREVCFDGQFWSPLSSALSHMLTSTVDITTKWRPKIEHLDCLNCLNWCLPWVWVVSPKWKVCEVELGIAHVLAPSAVELCAGVPIGVLTRLSLLVTPVKCPFFH